MATIKHSRAGTTKCMTLYMLFGKACFSCRRKLSYSEFQVAHLDPRFGKKGGIKGMHDLQNLMVLCKACNSAMGKARAVDYFEPRIYALLAKVHAVVLPKAQVERACDIYAKANPNSKFAKLHKQGKYHNTR